MALQLNRIWKRANQRGQFLKRWVGLCRDQVAARREKRGLAQTYYQSARLQFQLQRTGIQLRFQFVAEPLQGRDKFDDFFLGSVLAGTLRAPGALHLGVALSLV